MSSHKILASSAGAVVLLLLLTGVTLAGSGPAVDWWVIGGGGGPSSSLRLTLNATLGQPFVDTSSAGSTSLSAGYWVACAASAAVAPTVSIASSLPDVVLNWGANAANAHFEVWVSTSAYLDPDSPGSETPEITAGTQYTDAGAGSSLVNHFYVVRGVNACGAPSGNSDRKGEFTYQLVAGGS